MEHNTIQTQAEGRVIRNESLAKHILRIAKSDISDQLKEGEIATLFAQEVHSAVEDFLKSRKNG